MGLAEWLGFKPQKAPSVVYWQQQSIDFDSVLSGILEQPIHKLWREQPHLRTVVGFVARNIAQLGLHAFERDDEDGRNRLRDSPLVQLLETPNPQTTQYELIYATVASMCLYDSSYWYVGRDNNAKSGWVIRHIPTPWVIGTVGASAFAIEKYKIALPNSNGKYVEVPAEDMIEFHGWSPADPLAGSSPVYALKTILAEQIHAQIYRDQMWQRGGRVGAYLTRPAEAPEWGKGGGPDQPSPRDRFIEQWRASYAGDNASNAGGTPLLEDGMELKQVGFNAKENQYVESAKLSLATVAQVYHINPTMVGLLDDANYSNVREFRRMLYGDTLGPILTQFEQRIRARLVSQVAAKPDATYVEFNLQAKLAGSFEEQGQIFQQAIGAPWMTVNEGRSRQNMPAIEGGDDLIRPLNVTQNGDQDPVPAEQGDEGNGKKRPPKTEDDEEDGAKSVIRNGFHLRV